MTLNSGAALVVYGDKAEVSAHRALTALADVCPDVTVCVHRDRKGQPTDAAESRFAKVTLLDWTPFDYTAYLDADTQVYADFSAGFQMLEDGCDLVIAPSQNQDAHDWLWHCGPDDKAYTAARLGFQALQLQAGVLFVAKNKRTRRLWHIWRAEWERYGNQDQGAFLRALHQSPVRVWLLGRPWNGGAVIAHHFGAIRRGQ